MKPASSFWVFAPLTCFIDSLFLLQTRGFMLKSPIPTKAATKSPSRSSHVRRTGVLLINPRSSSSTQSLHSRSQSSASRTTRCSSTPPDSRSSSSHNTFVLRHLFHSMLTSMAWGNIQSPSAFRPKILPVHYGPGTLTACHQVRISMACIRSTSSIEPLEHTASSS